MQTITKESETEIKIVETTPEVVIPEKVVESIVSLTDLKMKVESLNKEIAQWTTYRDTPLTELAKIDAQIEEFNTEKTKREALIVEAEKQGVVDEKPVAEPVKDVVVEPIVEEVIR